MTITSVKDRTEPLKSEAIMRAARKCPVAKSVVKQLDMEKGILDLRHGVELARLGALKAGAEGVFVVEICNRLLKLP